MKILIADDSAIIRRSLTKFLIKCNDTIEISEAINVPDAISKTKEIRPDILILDVMMPGGTGFDVMKTVREQDYKITVIVLTNFTTELNRKRSIEEKADYFLDKSNELDKLIEIVTKKNINHNVPEVTDGL